MSKQSCFKKTVSHMTLSFLLSIDRCVMKNVLPLLLFFELFNLPLYACMKKKILMKKDIPLDIRFLKLVHSEGKIPSVCFKNKHVVEEAKMLIKLIAVHSKNFIRSNHALSRLSNII